MFSINSFLNMRFLMIMVFEIILGFGYCQFGIALELANGSYL